MKKWLPLESKEVYRNKWMWVTEDRVATPQGKELLFGVMHKHPFALVIPWDGQTITLVGQYRYMVGEYSWELPQGHFEHSNIEETARTELLEETGFHAKHIEAIGEFWTAPGAYNQKCHVFLATGLTQKGTHRESSEEDMKCHTLTLAQFQHMVDTGEMQDGPTMAAMSLARGKGVFEKKF